MYVTDFDCVNMRIQRLTSTLPRTFSLFDYRLATKTYQSKDQMQPGLYAKRIPQKPFVKYRYFSPSSRNDAKGYEHSIHYRIVAHGWHHHQLSSFEMSGITPWTSDASDQQRFKCAKGIITQNFDNLKTYTRSKPFTPSACEIILRIPEPGQKYHTRDTLQNIENTICSWGIEDFFSDNTFKNTHYRRSLAWKNYTWVCVFQKNQAPFPYHSINHAHCVKPLSMEAHNIDDPLHHPIPITDNTEHIHGYTNLFNTIKVIKDTFCGVMTETVFGGLDVLCSDYVYWILGINHPPHQDQYLTIDPEIDAETMIKLAAQAPLTAADVFSATHYSARQQTYHRHAYQSNKIT